MRRAVLVVLLLAWPGGLAWAASLQVGVAGLATSVDPHFYNLQANISLSMHIFDRLTQRGPDARLQPDLAVSWQPVGDTVWEFRLRPGVRWQDGQAFSADDVAFSIGRAPHVPNSPSSFAGMLRAITRVEIVDRLTVRLHTAAPAPTLPGDLAIVAIVSRHVGEGATTADYDSGRAAVGTGPYRLVQFTRGERVVLANNRDWWGGRPGWDEVTIRAIPNPAARVAALLAGDVDMIDTVPVSDLARLRADPAVQVFSAPGLRVIFLGPDVSRSGPEPDITDEAGQPLPVNPLRDLRVRQALSIAINRQALVDRVIAGAATPTGQWMPAGTPGYVADIPVPTADPVKAAALLAEAGYPNGFRLALHAPNDRYPNDAATAQAVAQMWTRIGVKTSVDILPGAIYAPRGVHHEYAMGLWGWSNNTAEAGYALVNVLGSQDPASGRGVSNVAAYASPELDALTAQALATIDPARHDALLAQAVGVAVREIACITLFHLTNNWATRSGLTYAARADEQTLANSVAMK